MPPERPMVKKIRRLGGTASPLEPPSLQIEGGNAPKKQPIFFHLIGQFSFFPQNHLSKNEHLYKDIHSKLKVGGKLIEIRIFQKMSIYIRISTVN